jgi:hypothetical protein
MRDARTAGIHATLHLAWMPTCVGMTLMDRLRR